MQAYPWGRMQLSHSLVVPPWLGLAHAGLSPGRGWMQWSPGGTKQQRSRVPTTEWTDVPTVLLQSMVIIVVVGLR